MKTTTKSQDSKSSDLENLIDKAKEKDNDTIHNQNCNLDEPCENCGA